MPSNLIQPVWALHETTNGVFAVAKGVLTAATSGNVQPLALLAAEAFGATLAICQQTQLLVEKEARKHHTSYIVKFLKAKIGYSAHDSAIQLSSTNAGVRFLSLAAALLCTSSNFTGAEALALMIKASSQKDQLLPTLIQLQDLLGALDYKLVRTRFADDIVGWETFLVEHPDSSSHIRQAIRFTQLHPAVDELGKLVDAFRNIERVGEGDPTSIRITAAVTSPWIIAFTKWCLGIPPNIIAADGTKLLSQPNSKVTLVVEAKFSTTATVEIFRDIKNPTELWSGNFTLYSPSRWTGMLSIPQFGKRRLRDIGFDDNLGYKALIQALSYTPKLVKTYFRAKPQPAQVLEEAGMVNDGLLTESHIVRDYSQFVVDLWPTDTEISSILTKFMNLADPVTRLGTLKESETILDLPLVKTYIKDIRESCLCYSCSGDMSRLNRCSIEKFKESVVEITRDLLALSLFDTIDPVFAAIRPIGPNNASLPFNDAIRHIVFGSGLITCEVTSVFDAALSIICHKTSEELNAGANEDGKKTWIASACRGQVVYPAFFDAMSLRNRALLSLGGGPGVLEYEGLKHDIVVRKLLGIHTDVKVWGEVQVNGPQNLLKGEELEWQVKVGNRCLELSCGITSSVKAFNPMHMLTAAASSLFISKCAHKKDAQLESQDSHCYYITPCFDMLSIQSHNNNWEELVRTKTGVVAVSGNDGLRCFALVGGTPAIIRQSACLQCCIDICRRLGYCYVVA
jgi:hypothetical protein